MLKVKTSILLRGFDTRSISEFNRYFISHCNGRFEQVIQEEKADILIADMDTYLVEDEIIDT